MSDRFSAAYQRLLNRWPLGTSERMIAGTFGSTHVTTAGTDGENPPVLLLSGGGATGMSWTNLAAPLADRSRIIVPDLPGDPGGSIASGRLRTVDDLNVWIDEILDDCGATHIGIVGHSYGSMIALAYALARPARVSHLVLLEPNSCFAGMRPAYLLHALPILLRPNAPRMRRFIAWETGDADLDPDWLDAIAFGAEDLPNSRPVVPKRPSRDQLATLADTPVSVILAPNSKVHNAVHVADRARALLPTATVTTLSTGTHHMLPMSPADELARTIAEAPVR